MIGKIGIEEKQWVQPPQPASCEFKFPQEKRVLKDISELIGVKVPESIPTKWSTKLKYGIILWIYEIGRASFGVILKTSQESRQYNFLKGQLKGLNSSYQQRER